jgi:hypothetical protein
MRQEVEVSTYSDGTMTVRMITQGPDGEGHQECRGKPLQVGEKGDSNLYRADADTVPAFAGEADGVPREEGETDVEYAARLRAQPPVVAGVEYVPASRLEAERQAAIEARNAAVVARNAAESAGVRFEEERERFLRLAQTVLEGCRAIYAALVEGSRNPRLVTFQQARLMADAIGEGQLVEKLDEVLAEYAEGLPGIDRGDAEALARFILERQIGAGEAQVPWEARGASRERTRTAAVILQTARLGATGGVRPGTHGWLETVAGALVAQEGMEPHVADAVARHALVYLVRQEDPEAETAVSGRSRVTVVH